MNTTKSGDCLENFPIWECLKMGRPERRPRGPYFVSSRGSDGLEVEARNRLRLLGMDVENRVQLGDLQEVGNFLIQVQKL
jgi:hypothetical protein